MIIIGNISEKRKSIFIVFFLLSFGYIYHIMLSLTVQLIDIEVVVYEGTIREKPSDKKEARHFIKGMLH